MLGFAFNWFFIGDRLRALSLRENSVTLTELLCGQHRPMRILASIIILLSLGVYVASQFKAAGVTFSATLGVGEVAAITTGGGIVMLYTMTGGFWAVSVTDLIQGLVMAAAAILVPAVALTHVGGWQGMADGLLAADNPVLLDWWRGKSGPAAIGFLIGTLGIGLGYPGQPHVVNRFMAMRTGAEVRQGTWISLAWALIIYSGMLVAGWCGHAVLNEIDNQEAVLLLITNKLFSPVLAGVIIAAVLSAIMSTADSQLLVCASSVSYDLAQKRSRFSDRLTVVVVGVLAILAAIYIEKSIFDSVLFAWSALGAAFGPLLLVRLWRGQVAANYAFTSMASGFAITLIWYFTPSLKALIYELVPAFGVALMIALLGANQTENTTSTGA